MKKFYCRNRSKINFLVPLTYLILVFGSLIFCDIYDVEQSIKDIVMYVSITPLIIALLFVVRLMWLNVVEDDKYRNC